MSVYEYREKMKSLIDIFAAMDGEPGTTEAQITKFMNKIRTKSQDISEEVAQYNYLGMLLAIKADCKWYSALITSLKTQHNQNIQGYLLNSQQAYQMLVDYVPTTSLSSQRDSNGGGIAYVQHDDDGTTGDSGCSGGHARHGGSRNSGHGCRGGCT